MYWKKNNLVMERNEVHKFVNSDGITINSNTREIKTSFRYLGLTMYYKKLEKLLLLIDPIFIYETKKQSKTELEYEQRIFLRFKKLTEKTNPQQYLGNYAKYKRMLRVVTNLTKDSFLAIMRCNMHNVIDWDVEMTKKGPNYAIKAEVFTKIR